ncbi:MAG: ABC transporter permease [Treponema sp.]|jgi:ribose transport system permease protein|nr:ABC transporter permease [Treponema sp.]
MSDAATNRAGKKGPFSGGPLAGFKNYFETFKWNEHSTGLGFLLLFILATIVGWPRFLYPPANLMNIIRMQSYTGIIALGMTFIIISGGIDLSVGSMMAFAGGITIFFLNRFLGNSVWAVALAIVFCLILGVVCGFLNGFLITKGRIAPFITTLGTMAIFRSLILHFSKAANIESANPYYQNFGPGHFLSFPYPALQTAADTGGSRFVWLFQPIFIPIWIFLILALVFHLLLNNTRFGRYVCAVGANEQVARYSAINVQIIKLIPYCLTGFTVAVSSLLWSSRINGIQPSQVGSGYELDAIAAVVIGGTSMSGGKGSIVGTVMGAIMLGIINNMLVLAGVSSFLQQAARGLVIIAAVLLQYNSNKK